MDKGVPIRAISRCVSVLQAINRSGSLTMMDISHASQVPYPTASRIVQTLLLEGLIEREPSRKHYRPTALVQTLSHGFHGDGRLVQAARPHLVALTNALGWPASLTTHVGQSMVVRDSTHTLTTLTFNNYNPGYSLPLLECASGQVFLAFSGDAERAAILRTLRDTPDNAANNTLALLESGVLGREIREAGLATKGRNRFTNNPGKTSSIAAPIMDDERVAGALTLVFFSSAMKLTEAVERFGDAIRDCARAIGEDLVHQPQATAEAAPSRSTIAVTLTERPAA